MFCLIHLQNPGVKMANLLHESASHDIPDVMESYRTAQHLQTDSTGRAGILNVELQGRFYRQNHHYKTALSGTAANPARIVS